MIPGDIQAAFDDCGIAVKEGGWYPAMPPASSAYAELDDVETPIYDDFRELYKVRHAITLRLYALDPVEPRKRLRNALLGRNVPVSRIECTGQSYETKQFETVFAIDGEYTEKVRINQ